MGCAITAMSPRPVVDEVTLDTAATATHPHIGDAPPGPSDVRRNSLLCCPTDRPNRGWKPITRASIRARAVHSDRPARSSINAASRLNSSGRLASTPPDSDQAAAISRAAICSPSVW